MKFRIEDQNSFRRESNPEEILFDSQPLLNA